MTSKRKEQIQIEAERRLNLWLENSSFNEMTCRGSLMRFDMALGLAGYPFEQPKWMKGKKFNTFVTSKEFHSAEYDAIIKKLFDSNVARLFTKKHTKS